MCTIVLPLQCQLLFMPAVIQALANQHTHAQTLLHVHAHLTATCTPMDRKATQTLAFNGPHWSS